MTSIFFIENIVFIHATNISFYLKKKQNQPLQVFCKSFFTHEKIINIKV